MAFKRILEFVEERSIRNFTSRIFDLINKEYYLIGNIVITYKLISIFPLKFVKEYHAMMEKTENIEEKE